MKQGELQNCAICRLGVMHSGNPVFFRVTVEHMCVDLGAVNRRHGLELMMNSPVLAAVLGPDEDIAKQLAAPAAALVCMDCFLKPGALALLSEHGTEGAR